jgi:hypothetical protein
MPAEFDKHRKPAMSGMMSIFSCERGLGIDNMPERCEILAINCQKNKTTHEKGRFVKWYAASHAGRLWL